MRRRAIKRQVLVVRRLHQIPEKVEDLERHGEDEDLVALRVPVREQLAQDLREGKSDEKISEGLV